MRECEGSSKGNKNKRQSEKKGEQCGTSGYRVGAAGSVGRSSRWTIRPSQILASPVRARASGLDFFGCVVGFDRTCGKTFGSGEGDMPG
jgi:hypothetical protein